ncbi:hypothetical protein R3P38DRAFT_3250512 [Favolaschia claudopus]|uniref:Uncharacterized protein n=1 Tax=Favolaschia claudopus TaxID=2862362 RepID=A0AAW0EL74_9AGAR
MTRMGQRRSGGMMRRSLRAFFSMSVSSERRTCQGTKWLFIVIPPIIRELHTHASAICTLTRVVRIDLSPPPFSPTTLATSRPQCHPRTTSSLSPPVAIALALILSSTPPALSRSASPALGVAVVSFRDPTFAVFITSALLRTTQTWLHLPTSPRRAPPPSPPSPYVYIPTLRIATVGLVKRLRALIIILLPSPTSFILFFFLCIPDTPLPPAFPHRRGGH